MLLDFSSCWTCTVLFTTVSSTCTGMYKWLYVQYVDKPAWYCVKEKRYIAVVKFYPGAIFHCAFCMLRMRGWLWWWWRVDSLPWLPRTRARQLPCREQGIRKKTKHGRKSVGRLRRKERARWFMPSSNRTRTTTTTNGERFQRESSPCAPWRSLAPRRPGPPRDPYRSNGFR